ncbi:hypothetical protein N9F65_00940 [bacterium]|nr:hypothetical protein [bacterium]
MNSGIIISRSTIFKGLPPDDVLLRDRILDTQKTNKPEDVDFKDLPLLTNGKHGIDSV